ncbi:hypothetical protein Tco_1106480 [Tanacetum coccineum]
MTKKKTPEQSLKLKGIEMLSDAAMLKIDTRKEMKANLYLEEDWVSEEDDVILTSDDERTQSEKETTEKKEVKELKEIKQVDHSTTIHASIKSQVLAVVNEYLGSNPNAGPDQGLKKRKIRKDVEPSKKPISAVSSKGTTQSQLKPTGKFVQAEETILEAEDTDMPLNQGDDTRHTDKQPNSQDQYGNNLTRRALSDQLDWNNPKGKRCPYDLSKPLPLHESRGHLNVPTDFFFNNDLEYLRGGSTDRKYTASTTKIKAAKYKIEVGLRMYTQRIVIQSRVEDLQLGVESYQKKLNISKPRSRDVDLSRRAPYTTLSEPQGVIYEDKLKRKIMMRTDEIYKFSDGTLTSVRNTLDQMLKNLMLGYNKAMERRK